VSTQAQRRRQRKEIRLIQNHSSWLQKALFALQKAETAREKLADARGEDDPGGFIIEYNGDRFDVDAFEEALESRVQELLTVTRERRRAMR
jgi:hypothetical protein